MQMGKLFRFNSASDLRRWTVYHTAKNHKDVKCNTYLSSSKPFTYS